MKKRKIIKRTILYALVAYLAYIIYILPKKDWNNNVYIGYIKNNNRHIFYPNQCLFVQYLYAWWISTYQNKQLDKIIDEHLLGKIGIDINNL